MSHGGKRSGAGRPKGSVGKLAQAMEDVRALIGDGETPLDMLLSVMRDEKSPMPLRVEAARAAAPYVHRRQPMAVQVSTDAERLAIVPNVLLRGVD